MLRSVTDLNIFRPCLTHHAEIICMYVYTWSFPPKWRVTNDKTDTSKTKGLSSKKVTKRLLLLQKKLKDATSKCKTKKSVFSEKKA